MSAENIVRAWKDPSYRASLDAEGLSKLPLNPVASNAWRRLIAPPEFGFANRHSRKERPLFKEVLSEA